MLPKTIMIMAGGTGGHVYPALAVAQLLQQQQCKVLWLGTHNGLEAKVIPAQNIPLFYLDVAAVRGSGVWRKISAPWLVLRAIAQALRVMLRHKPNAVLGMGGFASGPGGIAAFLLRIPLCIHEQNAVAGLTNTLLKPFARTVLQAFPATFKGSAKIITTGNPVRKEILQLSESTVATKDERQPFRILVIGGSLGARRLNEVVPLAVQQLNNSLQVEVRHQSGINNITETRQQYQQLQVKAEVIAFIDDMADAYGWADIVICRAGAMTVAELSIVGIAAIFIPYPYAVDDHQTLNARYLTDHGYAVLLQQSELTVNTLAAAIQGLCVSHTYLYELATKIRKLGRPLATQQVAAHCLEMSHA